MLARTTIKEKDSEEIAHTMNKATADTQSDTRSDTRGDMKPESPEDSETLGSEASATDDNHTTRKRKREERWAEQVALKAQEKAAQEKAARLKARRQRRPKCKGCGACIFEVILA